jgi:hypothetical protein
MKKAGDLLSAFFDRQMLRTAQGYSELFSSWQSIAGEKLACHSWIRELDRSILLIEADHPGWIQILQSKQADLLDRVRSRFPELTITGISFRLGKEGPPAVKNSESVSGNSSDKGAPSGREASPNTDASSTVEAPSNILTPLKEDEALARIEDPDFKEALLRLKKGIDARSDKKLPR